MVSQTWLSLMLKQGEGVYWLPNHLTPHAVSLWVPGQGFWAWPRWAMAEQWNSHCSCGVSPGVCCFHITGHSAGHWLPPKTIWLRFIQKPTPRVKRGLTILVTLNSSHNLYSYCIQSSLLRAFGVETALAWGNGFSGGSSCDKEVYTYLHTYIHTYFCVLGTLPQPTHGTRGSRRCCGGRWWWWFSP